MTSLARSLAAIALILAPAGYLAEAQVRFTPFASPPVLPPSAIPLPLTPQTQPLTPLAQPPTILPLTVPGPVFGSPPPPPPPPPPLGSQYWTTLWAELGPTPCAVEGVQLPADACEMIDVATLLWNLRDSSRQSELLKELARHMAEHAVRLLFNAADPLEFRLEAVEAIYVALQAEFDNVLDHAGHALMDAPATTLIQRAFAIADAVAVEDLQMRVAAESRANMTATVDEVRSHPERESVNLFREGPAYRQAVAINLGRMGFD